MPGDTSEYLRGKIAERGRQGNATFSTDGFDRWAESSDPARSGQGPKLPTEMPMQGGGLGSFLKKAGKAIGKVAKKGAKFYKENKEQIHGAIDLAQEYGPGVLKAVGVGGAVKLNVITASRPHSGGRWYLEWNDIRGLQSLVFPSQDAAKRWAEMQGMSGAGIGSFLKKAGKAIGKVAKKGAKFYKENKEAIHGAIDLAQEYGPDVLKAVGVGGRKCNCNCEHGYDEEAYSGEEYEMQGGGEEVAAYQVYKMPKGSENWTDEDWYIYKMGITKKRKGGGLGSFLKKAGKAIGKVAKKGAKFYKENKEQIHGAIDLAQEYGPGVLKAVGVGGQSTYEQSRGGTPQERKAREEKARQGLQDLSNYGRRGGGLGSFLKKAGKAIGKVAKKGAKFYKENKEQIHGAIDLAQEYGPDVLKAVGVGGMMMRAAYETDEQFSARVSAAKAAELKKMKDELKAKQEESRRKYQETKAEREAAMKAGREQTMERLRSSREPQDVQGGGLGSFLKKAGKAIGKVAKKGAKFYKENKDTIHGAIDLAQEYGPGVLKAVGVGGRKPNARAMIVKKIMAQKGLSMIEASKYVKAHGLY